ncbi:MAG: FecR domain-containing protein [Candidatus Hydrogenedentes bacterium]|nr:FecR domain-containing protein [Candidatus Hydrogenedentota bacterium]
MASCTKIANGIQAYLDKELGHSERLILEEHIAQCPECAEALRAHHTASALLFEALAPDRLNHSLRQAVLDQLPVMDKPLDDIDAINWRAKHPHGWTERTARLVPAAAIVLLVVLTIILRFSYPEGAWTTAVAPERSETVGIVAFVSGSIYRTPGDQAQRLTTTLRSFVRTGDLFETGSDSSLMLSLRGESTIKAGGDTLLKVNDNRRLSIDAGRLWADVGKDGNLFKVVTPAGLITVLGTAFSVEVANDLTTVTVERGEVQVECGEHLFRLGVNQQVRVYVDGTAEGPFEVEAVKVHAWAHEINAAPQIQEVFAEAASRQENMTELSGKAAFVIDTVRDGRALQVDVIRIAWSNEPGFGSYCAYEVSVSDGRGDLVHSARLNGAVFSEPGITSYDVVLKEPIRNKRTLYVRLIPDLSTGDRALSGLEVKARVTIRP